MAIPTETAPTDQAAPAMRGNGLKTPHFWLRVAQVVFGIIAFAPVAEFAGYSRVDFAIFCGVTTMLFSLVLGAFHLLNIGQIKGLPCLVYDGLYFIFWLACAAALSNMLGWYYGLYGDYKSRLQCSVAFSWLTWFLFIAAVVLDVMDLRAGAGRAVAKPAPDAGAETKGGATVADAPATVSLPVTTPGIATAV